ncbi:MAG: hypothetical protein RIC56_02565 [Pseudomonadales bacterium]
MLLLRIGAAAAFVITLIGGATLLAARLSDGPIGPIAGGPFDSGEPYRGSEPDWRHLADRDTVEFQLVDPARSRTTWILVQDGRLFIPCGYMNTEWGRIWKRWPVEAEVDGRALLRVDGTLYRRQLRRVRSGPLLEPLVEELNRKYAVGATADAVASGSLWLFELAPASESAGLAQPLRG